MIRSALEDSSIIPAISRCRNTGGGGGGATGCWCLRQPLQDAGSINVGPPRTPIASSSGCYGCTIFPSDCNRSVGDSRRSTGHFLHEMPTFRTFATSGGQYRRQDHRRDYRAPSADLLLLCRCERVTAPRLFLCGRRCGQALCKALVTTAVSFLRCDVLVGWCNATSESCNV